MNPKFRPLTRREMFYGVTPKTNLLSGGTVNSTVLVSKFASTPTNQTYISPTPNTSINTDVIAQQHVGFVLMDFLWKYRWPIGISAVLIAGAIWYIHSANQTKDEEQKS